VSARGFSALRHRPFLLFLTARFLVALAVQMQTVAVGYQVYELTGKTLDLGLVGLSQFLPFLVLVLPAGQAADRWDRKIIMLACYATDGLCAIFLLGFTLSGRQDVWPVYLAMVVFGSARAFGMPTTQAMMPALVPPEDFHNAVALNSSSFHVATIVGPTFGGLLCLAGPRAVYGAVALFFTAAIALMARVRLPELTGSREPVSWRSFLDGIRFVLSRRVVLGAISLDLFAVLFGGATALLPAYARDVLGVGPPGLGLLRTAPGAGAACMAILLAFHPLTRRVGRWMFAGVALFGIATIVFGISKAFGLSFTALLFLGAGDMVSMYIRHVLIQLETPDAIRGRVSAVNAVFIGASNELGEFESGVTAHWFGLMPAVILGGAATLAVVWLWMRLFPELRAMERFPDPPG